MYEWLWLITFGGEGRCFWGSALCTKLVIFFVFGWGRCVFLCVFWGGCGGFGGVGGCGGGGVWWGVMGVCSGWNGG